MRQLVKMVSGISTQARVMLLTLIFVVLFFKNPIYRYRNNPSKLS